MFNNALLLQKVEKLTQRPVFGMKIEEGKVKIKAQEKKNINLFSSDLVTSS